jgi:pullulanase-type alpha-1,6-glucosidase
MRHLRSLAAAGVTDLHLLPVFDFATVPERGCATPALPPESPATADSEGPQAAVMAQAQVDCYDWGYDPLHYAAPEGSYASEPADGAVRVREFRAMVLALNRAGLRVGMDMVFNHTSASGPSPRSVLDRVVPGYYHRLNAQGAVETSSCCANTATERRMMARLMIDSAVVWARDYRIDSMRFDLMGHQPRAAMEVLQRAVDQAAGRHIHLLGEGWNFGEVADGARFVQASQASLNGSGIATFSDRARDALRGGGCCDNTPESTARQGWLNGQFYAPNGRSLATRDELLHSADLVRVGLAGTLEGYRFRAADGSVKASSQIAYAGHGAGYASQPGEVVNYVENHDNPTLFDLNVLKLPLDTSPQDRARVQVLGLAVTAFSQGMAYFHAGVELLRSKNGDRNSYNSGDWFNRIDWTARTNHWGSGLPPEKDNGPLWPTLKPLLADPGVAPQPAHIRFARDAFKDLLQIRASSSLFRLRTAEQVQQRLTLLNTGPEQNPAVVVGHLDGRGLPDAGFAEVLYAINASPQAAVLNLPTLQGKALQLHPVHRSAAAADTRPVLSASWNAAAGLLTVPPRTALVYVPE